MRGPSWSHKLYWCQKNKGTVVCTLSLKGVNYWMPRKFVWTDKDDLTSLHQYIDALHSKNKAISSVYEDKGMAVEHEYEPVPDVEMVRVDPLKLMAILRGEYVLDIPYPAKVVLADPAKKQNKYMPLEVAAALLAADGPLANLYLKTLRERVAQGLPVLCMSEQELKGKPARDNGIELWDPNQHIRTETQADDVVHESTEHPEEPSLKETEVSTTDHGTYIETITSCSNYFIRRLLLDGKVFYAGSSYDGKQWSVSFIEQAIYDTVFQPETATP